jgi:hypothetical protein
MDAALQDLVRRRAHFRCEYCLLPASLVTTPFQFDHIIAQSHGGETTADNLALACFHCNNFKGPNLARIDPESGDVVVSFIRVVTHGESTSSGMENGWLV